MDDTTMQRIQDIVASCLEAIDDTGKSPDVLALCDGERELAHQVGRALGEASRFEHLQAAGVPGYPVLIGSDADRYRIDGRLGAGATGAVYSALDTQLGRAVAIKVLHAGGADLEEARLRFERESLALASVRHDAVVAIHGRGRTANGAPFHVMELVDGVSLGALLDHAVEAGMQAGMDAETVTTTLGITGVAGATAERQGVHWIAEVAKGVEAIHAAGIVHRDIKPSNVMIRRDGRPVLLDFGAVSMETEAQLTRDDATIGTPAYMAPEVLQGRDAVSTAADVYGLGATLYHLIAAKPPYEGAPTRALTALATREPVPISEHNPGVAKELQAIVAKGMAREPGDRYADARALRADLESFLAGRPVVARTVRRSGGSARRVMGASLALTFLIGVLLSAVAIGAWSWSVRRSQQQAERRTADFQEAFAALPANLGIVSRPNRVVADEQMARGLSGTLDRLVSSTHQDVTGRMLRGTFRFDQGDFSGAAEDMRVLAALLGTDFGRELAFRYGNLQDGVAGASSVNLETLPEPLTPLDRYVAGYHAIRSGDMERASELLSQPLPDGVRHAAELELLFEAVLHRQARAQPGTTRGSTLERVRRLESESVGQSAMTAHIKAIELITAQRYKEALETCEAGIAQAPASHSLMQNAAFCAIRCGLYDEADHWIERSIALTPTRVRTYELGMRTRLHRKDYAAAREWLRSIPFADASLGERRRRSWNIRVSGEEALHAFLRGSERDAVGLAANVVGVYGSEGGSLDVPLGSEDRLFVELCRAIVTGDRATVLRLMSDRAADEPFSDDIESLRCLLSESIGDAAARR